jgi:hypothetical protein
MGSDDFFEEVSCFGCMFLILVVAVTIGVWNLYREDGWTNRRTSDAYETNINSAVVVRHDFDNI